MFRLLKYYLDLVTPDGTAFVGYAARLRLGPADLGYSSLLVAPSQGSPRESTAFERWPLPVRQEGTVRWACPPLRLDGTWASSMGGLQRALLQGPRGAIHWTCLMPRAEATVDLGGTRLEGSGYVECLRLTLAPWRLPFRVLRWGRYVSATRSLVWIAWEGREPGAWYWLDGVRQIGALTESGLRLGEGSTLHFDDRRDVRNRTVIPSLGPVLQRVLPGPGRRLAAMHEHKELSRAALIREDRVIDSGWALHERVTW